MGGGVLAAGGFGSGPGSAAGSGAGSVAMIAPGYAAGGCVIFPVIQLFSTISSALPSGSRNQNIGGTGPTSSTAPIRIAVGAPLRATSASTSTPLDCNCVWGG